MRARRIYIAIAMLRMYMVRNMTSLVVVAVAMVLFRAGDARAPTPSINVAVFSECQGAPPSFSTTGGGAPYSGLVGAFQASDIQFATTFGFNWHPFGQGTFGADMRGFLDVASTGTYTFTLTSDDGSLLLIDGTVVVNNGGPHGPTSVSGSVALTAGKHEFEVQFFECCGGPSGVDLTLPPGVSYEPADNTCPLTQGFWKNHPEAWLVASLTLGSHTYTQAELLTILDTPVRGDASLILAKQLIAATLNLTIGADPAPITVTLADANSLLSGFAGALPYGVDPSSATGQAMVNDATVLDAYNSGSLTPNCTP